MYLEKIWNSSKFRPITNSIKTIIKFSNLEESLLMSDPNVLNLWSKIVLRQNFIAQPPF